MNFLLGEMTFLKYFIPLVEEGNKRGIKSKMFCWPTNKYNCVLKNFEELKRLAKTYSFQVHDVKEISQHEGIVFCTEGVGSKFVDEKKHTVFSIPYGTDYVVMYKDYIDKIDYSIFPSEEYAIHGKTMSDKNLYLGSPKYQIDLDEDFICQKYGLNRDSKKAIIIYPDAKYYPAKVDLKFLYSALKSEGYEIIVKTRGKNPIGKKEHQGDYYLLDSSWYPHTAMEIIKVVDLVVTHETSSAIKEAVFFRKPFLDMDIKLINKERPVVRDVFRFFYDYNFHRPVTKDESIEEIRSLIRELENENYDDEFEEAIEKYLKKDDNVCSEIIDTAFKLEKNR
jgi:hypothetical protein